MLKAISALLVKKQQDSSSITHVGVQESDRDNPWPSMPCNNGGDIPGFLRNPNKCLTPSKFPKFLKYFS